MINKKFDEKYNFWIISCDEGEVISDWSEEKEIIEYTNYNIKIKNNKEKF